MTEHLVAWADVESVAGAGGVARRRIDLPGMALVAVSVPAGTEAGRHSHDHDQFVQVVSGAGLLTTEQGSRPFAAGSVFAFPRGTWHAARFDADTLLVETNLAGG